MGKLFVEVFVALEHELWDKMEFTIKDKPEVWLEIVVL